MTPPDPDQTWSERYSRQILLKEIGGGGQKRLGNASVGLIGCGTTGMTTLLYLAAAGIGRLCLIDDALVTPQEMFPDDATGTPQVTAATHWIQALNPTIHLAPLVARLTPATLPSWSTGLDLIIDCGQTLEWLNPACIPLRKPLLSAWRAHADHTTWLAGSQAGVDPQQWPCLACTSTPQTSHAPTPPDHSMHRLQQGLIGTLLATEAIKALLHPNQTTIWTTLLGYNRFTSEYQRLPNLKNPLCPVCAHQPARQTTSPAHTQPTQERPADAFIDITQESCPMTFVRVKLQLETMAPGQRLQILLKGEEPLANLPRTLTDEGCSVSLPWKQGDAHGLMVTKPDHP